MKLNRTALNRRPGSRTTHQVQLRSVDGTYCNLRHTHTPTVPWTAERRALWNTWPWRVKGKWTLSHENERKKNWLSLLRIWGGHHKMRLVEVRKRRGKRDHKLCLFCFVGLLSCLTPVLIIDISNIISFTLFSPIFTFFFWLFAENSIKVESHHAFFSGVKLRSSVRYWDFVIYLGGLHTTINASAHWVQSLYIMTWKLTQRTNVLESSSPAESLNLVKDWLPQMHSGRGITAAPMTLTGFWMQVEEEEIRVDGGHTKHRTLMLESLLYVTCPLCYYSTFVAFCCCLAFFEFCWFCFCHTCVQSDNHSPSI